MSTLREQIAARRAEVRKAATPVKGQARRLPSDDTLPEERTSSGQIKKAVRSGKLDISGLNLHRIPAEVYTTLAGIETSSLTRPPSPPRPRENAIRPIGSRNGTPQRQVEEESRDRVFNQPARETWVDPEELTAFRAPDNRILEIEREIGAFGGLRSIDLRANGLKSLPDSFADLLKLSTIDLSHNAFSDIPGALLRLPNLQVLDLSHNVLTTIDLSNPVSPSEEGLSYGAGFLSTAFSRAQNRSPLTTWPAIRSLNLGHNRLSNDGLKGLRINTRFVGMRILNLERNSLQGMLDVEAIGAGIDDMPELATLTLNGNARLRGTEGDLAPDITVEMEGCGIGGQSRTINAAPTSQVQAQAVAVGDAPTIKPAGNGSGAPLPDLTMTYRTCPAATFDSEPMNIQFDLYLPPTPSANVSLIIWFHGGGLLQGNKENLPPHFRRLPQHTYSTPRGDEHTYSTPRGDEQVAVLSPNYRLAPQVPIIDILSDITHLVAFVQTHLNSRLKKEGKEYTIDTDRICLSGGSAGGYLALIAGLGVPKSANDETVGGYRGESGIKCIAPFYPITDLIDEFWSTETNPVPWMNRSVTHAEAKPHLDPKAAPVDSAISGGPRSILYPYMLQHSLFPSLLFKAQRSIGRGMDAFRPTPESLSIPQRLDLLKASGGRHVPIYLIYGDSDTAVQKFEKTVDALKGVEGELEIEVREGADHAFDEVESEECLAFRDWVGRVLL